MYSPAAHGDLTIHTMLCCVSYAAEVTQLKPYSIDDAVKLPSYFRITAEEERAFPASSEGGSKYDDAFAWAPAPLCAPLSAPSRPPTHTGPPPLRRSIAAASKPGSLC